MIASKQMNHVARSQLLAVNIEHDPVEGVWYVLSSDVPGLNAEAGSLEELIAVIEDVAPDLIDANFDTKTNESPDFALSVRHTVNVARGRAA